MREVKWAKPKFKLAFIISSLFAATVFCYCLFSDILQFYGYLMTWATFQRTSFLEGRLPQPSELRVMIAQRVGVLICVITAVLLGMYKAAGKAGNKILLGMAVVVVVATSSVICHRLIYDINRLVDLMVRRTKYHVTPAELQPMITIRVTLLVCCVAVAVALTSLLVYKLHALTRKGCENK